MIQSWRVKWKKLMKLVRWVETIEVDQYNVNCQKMADDTIDIDESLLATFSDSDDEQDLPINITSQPLEQFLENDVNFQQHEQPVLAKVDLSVEELQAILHSIDQEEKHVERPKPVPIPQVIKTNDDFEFDENDRRVLDLIIKDLSGDANTRPSTHQIKV
jgi:hypothetical protein